MIEAVREKIFNVIKRQEGMALPVVLAMFAIGSLLIVPSISYIGTTLNAESKAEEEFKGILAADAGVEDALWKIKNDTPDFLDPYTITDINGLSVDIDINEVTTIFGEPVDPGSEAFWLELSVNVTYDDPYYNYTLSATNNGEGNIKVAMILIDFPPGVDYVSGSTSSNITNPTNGDPTTINGSPATGIILIWDNPTPHPCIAEDDTEYHCFKLSGPPGIEGMEGEGFVEAARDNVGTVWLGNVTPYSITAEAKDGSEVVATIRAGVWAGTGVLEISCWQVIP